jgi:hypothetical protein
MKPLIDVFQELAEAQPWTTLVMLELGWIVPGWHPGGMPPMPAEKWLFYFRLAVDDPRLGPRAKAKLTEPNFFWEMDRAGVWNIMAYDRNLRIALPFMREASPA